ncbi:MAG: CDP-alcohol phosphatidyltransferase family protein [Candidatus Kapabacteria bacterium]|nr:CDP-alcohol phosphatidyltransferase family protein [Candidatus Kapabacteria bacterium]
MKPSERFWTASNVMSLVRLILTVPLVWMLWHDQRWTALMIAAVAAVTDWADGRIARATGTVSDWGKIIDPVADKVLVGSVVVVMTIKELLPLWFVICVVLRDVIILIGGIIIERRTGQITPSLMVGKLAVTAVAITGMIAIMQWSPFVEIGIGLSSVLMVLSLWQYSKRFHGILQQAQRKTR